MRNLKQIAALVAILFSLTACEYIESNSNDSNSTAQNYNNSSESINLSWSAPDSRTDGTYLPFSELAGYRVYMGTASNNMTPLVELDDENITQYTVSDLPSGDYYFAVTAYDTDGTESSFSQIVLINFS